MTDLTLEEKEQLLARPIVRLVNAEVSLSGLRKIDVEDWPAAIREIEEHLFVATDLVRTLKLGAELMAKKESA